MLYELLLLSFGIIIGQEYALPNVRMIIHRLYLITIDELQKRELG